VSLLKQNHASSFPSPTQNRRIDINADRLRQEHYTPTNLNSISLLKKKR